MGLYVFRRPKALVPVVRRHTFVGNDQVRWVAVEREEQTLVIRRLGNDVEAEIGEQPDDPGPRRSQPERTRPALLAAGPNRRHCVLSTDFRNLYGKTAQRPGPIRFRRGHYEYALSHPVAGTWFPVALYLALGSV